MTLIKKSLSVFLVVLLCGAFAPMAFSVDTYTPVYSKISDSPAGDLDINFPVTTENDGRIMTNKSVTDTSFPVIDISGNQITDEVAQAFSAGNDDFAVALSALAQTYKEITELDSRSQVNVILTIDNSSSMYNEGSMLDANGNPTSRMGVLKTAARTFIDALALIGDTTQLQMSIVAYMGSASTVLNWSTLNTQTKAAARSAISGLSKQTYPCSFTDPEAGLYLTKYLYTQPGVAPENVNDSETKNFVIFMSDGGPNRYYYDIENATVSQNATTQLYELDKTSSLISPDIKASTDYLKLAATKAFDQAEDIYAINNMTMYTLGLSDWFTTEAEDSGFPTAVNFLKLCAAVSNGVLTAEEAKIYCGDDIPAGSMPGKSPHYPIPNMEDFTNDGSNAAQYPVATYPYMYKKSSSLSDKHFFATAEECMEYFVSVCGDLETRSAQGVHSIPSNVEEAIQNYYAGNTTQKFEDSFTDISVSIKLASGDYVTSVTDIGMEDISGFVSIIDYPGEYMEVKSVNGVYHNEILYDGETFAREFSDISWLYVDSVKLDKFRDSLHEKNDIPSSRAYLRDVFLGAYAAGTIYYNNDSDYSNYLRWYSDDTSSFQGTYYAADGSVNPVPEDATRVVDSYFFWSDDSIAEEEEHIYFLGVTVGTDIATGVQSVCFNVPASLLPTRTVKVENAVAVLEENILPITLVYTVGLKDKLTNVREDYPYYDDNTGLYSFYANAWEKDNYPGSAQAHAIFTPSTKNPFYFCQEKTPIYNYDEQSGEYVHSTAQSDAYGYMYYEAYDESGIVTAYDRMLKPAEMTGSVPNMQEFLELGEDGYMYALVGAPKTTSKVYENYEKTLFQAGNATNTNPVYRCTYYYSAEDAASNIIFDTGVSAVDAHPDMDIAVTLLGNNGLLQLNSIDLEITKIWNDNGNAQSTRPASVTFNVLRDGALYDTITVTAADCTVTGNTWVYNYNAPFGYDNYSVEEVPVEEYLTDYSEDTFTITNTLGSEQTVILDYGLSTIIPMPAEIYGSTVTSAAIDATNSDLNFGTAQVGVTGNVIYTPSSTCFNGFDTVYCTLTLNDATQVQQKIYVLPATNIYYEDSFLTFTNGTTSWTEVGETNVGSQDCTGSYIYGYDPVYSQNATYSNGSAMSVTVSTNSMVWPTAYFEFYGTMVDILSATGDRTGLITVDVVNLATGATVKSNAINTFYEDADNRGMLYQIPVLRCDMRTYGHYGVTLTAAYAPYFDINGSGSYDAVIDAVRIYNAAGTALTSGRIYDAYVDAGELNPVYGELRNCLLTVGDGFQLVGGATGAMYVAYDPKDSTGGSNTTSLATYNKNGPNHEVYLENNDAIAFRVNGFAQGDTVHISAKSPTGDETPQLTVNGTIIGSIRSATEQYYDITSDVGADGTVVITNSGGGILSLVGYKLISSGEQPLSLLADEEVLDAAVEAVLARDELAASFLLPETFTFPSKIVCDDTEYSFDLIVPSTTFTVSRSGGVWTAIGYINVNAEEQILQVLAEQNVPVEYKAMTPGQQLYATWVNGEWVTQETVITFTKNDTVTQGSTKLQDFFMRLINMILKLFLGLKSSIA